MIEAKSVPLSPAARAAIDGDPERLAAAFTGGDDYEVLFTAPATAAGRICELSRLLNTPITPIGRMKALTGGAQSEVVVLDNVGRPLSFASEGWTHFGNRSDPP